MLSCALQVRATTTRTLSTQRTTVICSVQTPSRSSLIGPRTSKHWCSWAPAAPYLKQFLTSTCFWLKVVVCFSSRFLAHPLSCGSSRWLSAELTTDREKLERQSGQMQCCVSPSVGRPPLGWARRHQDPVPSQALPSLIATGVDRGSVAQTHRSDTKLTRQLAE